MHGSYDICCKTGNIFLFGVIAILYGRFHIFLASLLQGEAHHFNTFLHIGIQWGQKKRKKHLKGKEIVDFSNHNYHFSAVSFTGPQIMRSMSTKYER